jgi:hypothetical protein
MLLEKLHEASAAAARAKKQQNQKQKLLKQQVRKIGFNGSYLFDVSIICHKCLDAPV